MKTFRINSDAAPPAVGGYSQGLLVEEPKRLLFLSGQIPESPEGEVPPDLDSKSQSSSTPNASAEVAEAATARELSEEERALLRELTGALGYVD